MSEQGNGTADGGIMVQQARRSFGSVHAVTDISFVAPPGQVTALVGPNGSGKTTLMLMLASLLAPDSGNLRVAGFDPVTQPREVRRRLGWMPDGFGTFDVLTVREVLRIVADAYRLPRAESTARIGSLAERLFLTDLLDQPAAALSRGQKQRLGLARALIHDPSVLLLDEPASGLDPRSRIELREVLRELAGQGCTILVSSHILTELEEVADSAVLIDQGRTVQNQLLGAHRPDQPTIWRLRALDPVALAQALAHYRISAQEVGDAFDVTVPGETGAAALLRQLVLDGVPMLAMAPMKSALETAYLAATQERR